MAPHSTSPTRHSQTVEPSGHNNANDQTSRSSSHRSPAPIAIVGLGMRLPGGCNTAEQFWDFLLSKKEGMIPVPASRWNLSGFHDPSGQLPSTIKSSEGNFLADLDLGAFDGNFWSLPAAQVSQIDPQHRILLETVYEAVENAGDSHDTKGKKVGVYVGVFAEDWIEMHSKDPEQLEFFGYMGHFDLGASNLVSYEFDWRGPSMTFKTGCSGSMVALDTACKALAAGDCEAAVVGGTNLILSPGLSTTLSAYGVNSPDGRSRPFDAAAEGYGRAEAVSALYIKRLDDAVRDGNPIRAVIRASMCNDDGKTQGITQPSSKAQEALIRAAYESAGLSRDLGETAYFECHGTGTPVGDPLEAGAVARVFGESGGMIIGSVKSNVGHSESASGNTSIIKSILALEHRVIPPNVHFSTPNPKIPFQEANLLVLTEPLPWPKDRQERVSINSFGIGGSNAHVILESGSLHGVPTETGTSEKDSSPPRLALLLLSAKSDTSLQASVEAHTGYLAKNGPSCLADLSYTLGARREHHQQRTFTIAYGDEDDDQDFEPPSFSPFTRIPLDPRPVIFIFTGQGAQWAEMGKELIEDFPEVEHNFNEMDAILAQCANPPEWRMLDEIRKPKSKSRISRAEFSQPLCTALQIALVDLLQSWGVKAQAVAGHSSGEIAAAYAAGALTKRDAILAAYFRGYATRDGHLDGAMAAVGLGADAVRSYLGRHDQNGGGKVVIACENSPESTTISGDAEAVQSIISNLRSDAPEVFVRALQVDNAYHSHHMKAYGEAYEESIASIQSFAPTIPFFSSVTGKLYNQDSLPGTFDASYWRANLECPVLFHTAVKNILTTEDLSANPLVVEIGPHSALAGPLRQIFASSSSEKSKATYTYVATLQRGKDVTECLLTALGTLWSHGAISQPSATSSSSNSSSSSSSTSTSSTASSFPILSPNNRPPKLLTDLPTYKWDHTESYWSESRPSVEWRNRQFLPHEILGTRLPGASGLEPTWRNLLSLSKIPWVKDHVVGTDVVMPGVGYVAMAGEAVRQLHLSSLSPGSVSNAAGGAGMTSWEGYTIRDLSIQTAMILHEDDKKENQTDVLTTLRKVRLTAKDNNNDSPWWEFTITSSYNGSGGVWSEHCRGQARAGLVSLRSQKAHGEEKDDEKFVRNVSTSRWYKTLSKIGFHYGPAFSSPGLKDIRVDPLTRDSLAVVENVSRHHKRKPEEVEERELHPCEMDKMLQLMTVTQHNGNPATFKQLAMPTYFEEISVGAGFTGRESFEISARSVFDHMGSWKGNLSATTSTHEAVDSSNAGGNLRKRKEVFEIKGLSVSPMGSSAADTKDRESRPQNAVELVWQPDITFLSSAQIARLIRTPLDSREQQLSLEKYFILLALEAVPTIIGIKTSEPHLSTFRSWLTSFLSTTQRGKHPLLGASGTSLCALPPTQRKALLAATKTALEANPLSSALATCLSCVSTSLTQRFRGEVDSLSVLMEDGALASFYAFYDKSWDYAPLLRSIGHNKPTLRVLEIGAGTGGTTANMLRGLRCQLDEFAEGQRLYLQYCYTDISAGFFVAAKERFKDVLPGMEFRVLDITRDPVEQGFHEGSFDLILAANVLHATPVLADTLRNVRKLLDNNGRLLLQEIHSQFSWPGFVMGGLPGWWLGKEDGRTDGPAASPERWEQELKGAGFAGAKAVVFDNEEPFQMCATMLCEAAPPPHVSEQQGQGKRKVILLYRGDGDAVPETVALYQSAFSEAGCTVSWINFDDGDTVQIPDGWDVISLLDLQSPFLDNISGRDLTKLQMLIARVETVNTIWVTGLCSIKVKDPRYAQILGFTRTVRSERHISLTTIEVDDFAHAANPAKIAQLCQQHICDSDNDPELDPDYEFAILDGVVYSSRYHWFSVPQALTAASEDTTTTESEPDKVLMIGQRGMIDSVRWEDNQIVSRPLGPGEVSIRPHTVGVNFRDVLQTQGVVDGDDLGGECSGTILEVGPGVRDEFQPGSRVFLVSSYCFSNRLIASQDVMTRIPDDMSMSDAATMPIVFTTVLYSLLHLRRLEKGQTILIHSACGGVGLAAIQIARMVGARVLATAGNEDKARFLVDKYGIPRSEIFDSHSPAFVEHVLAATDGKGVDVALNSLAGELLHATWKCVAPFGAMIEIGKRDMYGHGRLDMMHFTENRAFLGVDIRHIQSTRPEIIGQMLRECAAYFEQGKIRPIPTYKNFSAAEIGDAFRHMQRGTHIGKFTVTMPENGDLSHLPTAASRQTSLGLQPDAGYLLVGGLGGVGRSIATWLVSNGAKHLIFLSRSGRDARSESFCRELQVLGAQVQVFKGSVTEKEDVERAVSESTVPIRGVIQLSMVLQDRAVDNMTKEDWYTAVRPKVDGTWNLHNALLRTPLDFFVMFASTSGMFGQYGQSNYAAANCFLDAFVQYRHGLGLAASVIDLGVMEDVGFVAESANLLDYFRFLDASLLTEEDMRESVALAIARSFPSSSAQGEAESAPPSETFSRFSNPSQVSVGVRSETPLSDPANRAVWKRDRRFAAYRSNMKLGGDETGHGADENLKSFVMQISSRGGGTSGVVESEAIQFLAKEMGKTLYGFMMKDAEDMQLERPLASLGLDSLVAIELRNWCRTRIGLEVSVLEIMQSTLKGLAEKAHAFLVSK